MAAGRSPQPKKKLPTGSFYARALDEADRLELDEARGIEGLDDEIAVLRFKLKQIVADHPERLDLCLDAANTIARLVRTRYQISREQKKSLKEAITKVITDIAIPAGVAATRAVLD
jgi:hypothetical protein